MPKKKQKRKPRRKYTERDITKAGFKEATIQVLTEMEPEEILRIPGVFNAVAKALKDEIIEEALEELEENGPDEDDEDEDDEDEDEDDGDSERGRTREEPGFFDRMFGGGGGKRRTRDDPDIVDV